MTAPSKIGPYTLLRPLASGGMAELFLARREGLRGLVKHVALKCIRPELCARGELVEAFLDEIRVCADFAHPNVVGLLDAGEEAGRYYLVLEYVDGADLRTLLNLAPSHRLPPAIALRILSDAARGLHYAHTRRGPTGTAQRVVHRDVSPSNLLVGRSGITRVADFGIATLLGPLGKAPQRLRMGKLPYMAPEQAAGAELGPAADLFALASVSVELLSGRSLFARPTEIETIDAILSASLDPDLLGQLPGALQPLLRRALSRRPEQRPESCAAFAEGLESVGQTVGLATASQVAQWLEHALVAQTPSEQECDSSAMPPNASPSFHGQVTDGISEAECVGATEVDQPLLTHTELRHSLPTSHGEFIGRVRDLDRLEAATRAQARWINLVGPGGVGKTRLALRHAELSLAMYEQPGGGVWFCDLGSTHDASGLCRKLAATLELELPAGELASWSAHLGHALAARGRLLLVLDNLEQLAACAAPLVGEWLVAAPELQLLTTSRRALRGPEETLLAVEPMATPDPDTHEVSQDSDAMRLFLDRAMRAREGRPIPPQEQASVSRLVRALDGLPLAIELAAARSAVLSVDQLLQRLDQRFSLLVNLKRKRTGAPSLGDKGPEARQATLEATIAWSWDQLEGPAQSMLAQCACFEGGFTLEAAEAVFLVPKQPSASRSEKALGPSATTLPLTIDLLQELKEHSLLHLLGSGKEGPRFGLYESIRAFAKQRLEDSELPLRHAHYYLEQAIDLGGQVDRGHGVRALHLLQADFDNLMLAQETLAGPEPGSRARLIFALEPLLHRTLPTERWIELLLDAQQAAERSDQLPLRATAHWALAQGYRYAGLYARCVEEAFVGRELARRAGLPALEAELLSLAGHIAGEQGDFGLARRRLDEAVGLLQGLDHPAILGRAIGRLGILDAKAGDNHAAQRRWTQSVALYKEADHPMGRANNLQNLALLIQGHDPERALGYYLDALAAAVAERDLRSEASTLNNVGTVYMDLGRFEEARQAYQRCLHLLTRSGDLNTECVCRASLILLEHLRGRLKEARAAAEIATAVCEGLGDRWLTGMARAHGAAVLARLGQIRSASAEFEMAGAELDSTGSHYFDDAFRLLTGLLDLARAREAAARGEGQAASDYLEEAQAKYRAALEPRPTTKPQHLDDETLGLSLYASDVDLRLAARLLAAGLREAGVELPNAPTFSTHP